MFNRKSEYTDAELNAFRDQHLANAREWETRRRECEAGAGPAGCDPTRLLQNRDREMRMAVHYGADPNTPL